jgi:uncharacterized protein YecE (DUF72 family)
MVEVDSTFYTCPTARTVQSWDARTPEGFTFSVKVPQTVTHDKVLVDCDAELKEFLNTMDILGDKLGPIVFQFPFFDKWKIKDRHAFTDRPIPFLKKLPTGHKFAVEIRKRNGSTPNCPVSCEITRSLSCFRIGHGCQA